MKAGLALALFGSVIGYVVPGYCEGQRSTDHGAVSQATTPTWVPTGNLNVARVGHTATLLPNGKVLVTGGRSTSPLASAELYDPANETWSLTGSMSVPRVLHTATLLSSGRVLVAGGDTSPSPPTFGTTNTAELYDPATGTWTLTGNLNAVSCCNTATLLQSGKVLVAGGYDSDNVKTAELYDPATGTWSLTGSLITARYGQTATLLQDGRVLAARGSDDGDLASTLASAELYDPVAGTWSATRSSAAGSVFHTATLLSNGKVLVAGGNGGGSGGDVILALSELFDPATQSWSGTGNLAAARYGHTATLLPTGNVLVAGGTSQDNYYPNLKYNNLDSVELYDSRTGIWTSAGSLNSARGAHTATLLPDGRVLVAGGSIVGPSYTTIVLNSAELYDSQTQTAVEYYYADWNYYFVTSFPAEIAALDGGAFGGLWQRTGETFNVWSLPTGLASPTCRFFSTTFAPKSSHFYTPFPSECAAVKNNPNWQFESIAFYIQIPTGYGTGNGFCPQGTAALYRLYNNGRGGAPNHRYTTSLGIFNTMLAQGWVFEGEANTQIFACVPP